MTDYTAKLFLQAHAALPDILAAATALDFTATPHLTCHELVAGPIADALTKAGADCCLEDQLGLAVMMLGELARRHSDLRSRLEDADAKAAPGATSATQAARDGYETAIATLLGVEQRTGSPVARWAADYLAVDPDKLAPGSAAPAGSCVCTGSGWPHVPSSARCTPPVGTQPLPLSIGRVQAYCGAVERPHAGHVWHTQTGRWCPGDEVPGRPEPRVVDTAPNPPGGDS